MIDAAVVQTILTGIAVTAVAAAAIRVMRSVGVSGAKVSDIAQYSVNVALALEEVHPLASGVSKFETAAERVMERFGVDREEAGVFVNAAVAGLRQAGIKVPRGGTPDPNVAAGVAAATSIVGGLKTELAKDEPALD